MKENELNKDYEKQKQILYVEKDDGSYGPVQTGSYLTNNYLDDFWLKKINLEKQLTEDVAQNRKSLIYYYMLLRELSEAELAARVGIPTRCVRKHLNMKHFTKIKVKTLERYAHVFGVNVADLFQIIHYEESNELKSFFIKDKEPELFVISQQKTDNPFLSITKIKKKTQ